MGAKKQTFEDALARLEKVVRELEDGNMPLEKALELFAEGISLSKSCHRALEDAERKISVLTADDKGELVIKEMPVRE